jgi:hypothetical protein
VWYKDCEWLLVVCVVVVNWVYGVAVCAFMLLCVAVCWASALSSIYFPYITQACIVQGEVAVCLFLELFCWGCCLVL